MEGSIRSDFRIMLKVLHNNNFILLIEMFTFLYGDQRSEEEKEVVVELKLKFLV